MRRLAFALIVGMAVIATAVIPVVSQTPPVQKPAFEVASIKLNVSGREGGSVGPRGDRFIATNVALGSVLNYAYSPQNGQLFSQQVIGIPEWGKTDRFDIQATMAGDISSIPREKMKLMLQSLLEDRFHLKAHQEMRDLPVYNLVVTKDGAKVSHDQTPPDPDQGFINFASPGEPLQPLPRGAMRMVRGVSTTILTGSGVSVSRLMSLLQGQSDRIVIDKTNLKALLDVNLQFSDVRVSASDVSSPDPLPGPSLFTAIQDLGLKLESAKAPLEVLVIESVQRPTEN